MSKTKPGFTEAIGTLVSVDRVLFLTMLKYFVDHEILEDFNVYLEEQGCYEVILDVALANHMKRFLLKSKRKDPIAKMALLCNCSGVAGGAPTPSGKRG